MKDMPDKQMARPRLFLGTYARNGGAGLHTLDQEADGSWSVRIGYAGAQNASFGTYSTRHGIFYFVDEQQDGAIGAYRLAGNDWQRLGRVSTGGAAPCYIALNAAEDCLAVANYGSGSIALFRLDAAGLPLAPPAVRDNSGNGPMPARQEGPHAHCACFSPDERWLYHVDLGTDEILAYPFDVPTGSAGERTIAYRAPSGSGPRHLVFHPSQPLALLVSELASTLTVLARGDADLTARQTISTLPADFAGESLGGHLSLNRSGDRVYVTNRGHDSVAVFQWQADGTLMPLQYIASGGVSPRSFVLLEEQRQLVLVQEESANITVFDVHADGTLSPTDTGLSVPGAAFLLVAS